MKNTGLIILNSISNNLRSKALTIVYIIVTLMIAAGLALFFCLLLIAPAMKAETPDRSRLELYLSLVMYTTCIISLGINLNVYAFQSMTREKSRGNIESLLATPVKIKSIWAAKSLAVFIPGMILAEVLTFSALMAVNYIYFVPKIGFLYTHWTGFTGFFVIPLVYLCLSLLAHLIGLAGKAATGNILVQVFFPVSLALIINLTTRNVLNAASWTFALFNLGLAAVLLIIILFLMPRLTSESIILSG